MFAQLAISIWLWVITNITVGLFVNIRQLSKVLLASAILLWSVGSFAASNYSGPNRDASGNIVPTPKGEKCVEPTADMRANHMEYLLHKRDKTMHEGIRTKQHSLVECIQCHVTPGEDGKVARITNEKHFCASCHRSASVTLDCFECHADRPAEYFSSELPHKDVFALNPALTTTPHVVLNRKVQ